MPLKLSTKAEEIAYARYYKDGESSWEDVAKRVGTTVSNGDSYRERYIEAIANGLFIPGGRILRNAGRTRGSLFNCYHLPIGDSRNEIGECFKNSLIIWGEGEESVSISLPCDLKVPLLRASVVSLQDWYPSCRHLMALQRQSRVVDNAELRRWDCVRCGIQKWELSLVLNWMRTRSITLTSASGLTTTSYKLFTKRNRGRCILIDKRTTLLELTNCGIQSYKTCWPMVNQGY